MRIRLFEPFSKSPRVHHISPDRDRDSMSLDHTTSLSLARALAVGCLSRLDPSIASVDIWDPAAGTGFAGFLLVDALQSAGIQVRYRGQDINQEAVLAGRRRFEAAPDAELAVGNTLGTTSSSISKPIW